MLIAIVAGCGGTDPLPDRAVIDWVDAGPKSDAVELDAGACAVEVYTPACQTVLNCAESVVDDCPRCTLEELGGPTTHLGPCCKFECCKLHGWETCP